MRILFACYFYLPHVGGLNTYVETLKKELEEHGHQVDILAHHPDMQTIYKSTYTPNEFGWTVQGSEIDKSLSRNENKITIKDVIHSQVYNYYEKNLDHVDPWIRWREIERYTFEVAASLLNLNDYDLIHTQDIVSTRALWRVKPKHVPLVATVHGILATEHMNAGDITSKQSLAWKYVAEEEYYGHMSTDVTIVPTNWQKKQLSTNYKVPSDKINVIPYGMDLVPFLKNLEYDPYPPLKNEQSDSEKFVIACPARLVPEKNHKTLIDALSILKGIRNDFVCWFIGDGKLRYELERQSKELNVRDNIVFLGNRWDVPALLKRSDIVVLASIQDMHPFALMEAQVAGKAIVASDAGGIPEIVRHGETGLIFERYNSSQLAQSLAEVMSNSELRSRLARNAEERGKVQWSSKTLYSNIMNVYNQALNLKKSSDLTRFTVAEPNLIGRYGLIKPRGTQNESAADNFKFEVDDSKFDTKKWGVVLGSVPADYSIPDTCFIQTLAETEHTVQRFAEINTAIAGVFQPLPNIGLGMAPGAGPGTGPYTGPGTAPGTGPGT